MTDTTELLWPDDSILPSTRDGLLAEMEGGRRYLVSRSLLAGHPDLLRANRVALTAHVMENGGEEPVVFTTHNIDAILARRPRTVKQKLDWLLRALAKRAGFQVSKFLLSAGESDRETNSIMREAGLSGAGEMIALLQHLDKVGLVDYRQSSSNLRVLTTIDGLVYVEQQDVPNSESQSAFVAMWFDPSMAAAYEMGIKPAIIANGYDPVRIDTTEHNNKIDDEIISLIRRARFIVADFSCGGGDPRGGVYFEAGFALGLGIQVIWCVQKDDLERVHFDTRQFNHIVWETPDELLTKLTHRIGATVGLYRAGTPERAA